MASKLLKHLGLFVQKQWMHHLRRWYEWRMQCAVVMWLEIFALMNLTISVKGITCIKSPTGAYVLMTQPSVHCWSRDHLPVYLASLTIFTGMGIVSPLLWQDYVRQYKTMKQMNRRSHLDRWGFLIRTFKPSGLRAGILLLSLDRTTVAITEVMQNLVLQGVLRVTTSLIWIGMQTSA